MKYEHLYKNASEFHVFLLFTDNNSILIILKLFYNKSNNNAKLNDNKLMQMINMTGV